MDDSLKYLILLIPLVGAVLLFGGIAYKRHLRQKVLAFTRVQGIVTGFASGISPPAAAPGKVYHPIIEYYVDKTAYSIQSNVGYGKPKEKEGSKMDILYDRSNPSTAQVVKDFYYAPHMMIAIGSMFLLMGTYMAYQLL